MEKDQNTKTGKQDSQSKGDNSEDQINKNETDTSEKINEIKEVTPEEKILELEDKLTRTFAEMENQRRRFEKEREDAFNYGGFALAKETLT